MEIYYLDVYREVDNYGRKGDIHVFCLNDSKLNFVYSSVEDMAKDFVKIRNGRKSNHTDGPQFVFSAPFSSRAILFGDSVKWLHYISPEEQEYLFFLLKDMK